ncbi:MAG: adenylate/guanylate cyclase domain-containing protein [Proteobacteria bacterium]|nr:adenylate/guanylate cyclase domain-containing protein [Pseudomonadota bacterium]
MSLDTRTLVRRYYLAMALPFVVDLASILSYVAVYAAPGVLLPLVGLSAAFLVVGVGIGAYFLIRPIRRYLDGEIDFAAIQRPLTSLPRRSCIVMAVCYAPMITIRQLARTDPGPFTAVVEAPTWIDLASSFTVVTGYYVLLTFFVVSAYMNRLCEALFEMRGVNVTLFRGRFRRKMGLALLYVAFAGMLLLAADIVSYSGDRLVRESTLDIVASISGTLFIFFWINHALNRPIARLDGGMHAVAEGDYSVRLPVTSDDEIGHATSHFNEMVEGLGEREYLRDTFGKYVNDSVAAAILGDRERGGRVADATAEATLMFTDIEGFTGLSERLPPAEVAAILNVYLGTIVPVIQRHGGVVNAFIGDGLFASFNLPLACGNHAAAGLAAAREMQRALAAATYPGNVSLQTRIGLNTGTAIGVTVGTENRMNYTLLGDAVNVASRIEQLNKQFATRILATESTVLLAGDRACEKIGTVEVRGHESGVVVYKVDAAA